MADFFTTAGRAKLGRTLSDTLIGLRNQQLAEDKAQLEKLKFGQDVTMNQLEIQKSKNQLMLFRKEQERLNKTISVKTLPHFTQAGPRAQKFLLDFGVKNGYIKEDGTATVRNLTSMGRVLETDAKLFKQFTDTVIADAQQDYDAVSKEIKDMKIDAVNKNKDISQDKTFIALTKKLAIFRQRLNEATDVQAKQIKKIELADRAKKKDGETAAIKNFKFQLTQGISAKEALQNTFGRAKDDKSSTIFRFVANALNEPLTDAKDIPALVDKFSNLYDIIMNGKNDRLGILQLIEEGNKK